jgi:hypothetical protein
MIDVVELCGAGGLPVSPPSAIALIDSTAIKTNEPISFFIFCDSPVI